MILIDEINEKIKQRPPFQMIDRVLEIVPNESAIGRKWKKLVKVFGRT